MFKRNRYFGYKFGIGLIIFASLGYNVSTFALLSPVFLDHIIKYGYYYYPFIFSIGAIGFFNIFHCHTITLNRLISYLGRLRDMNYISKNRYDLISRILDESMDDSAFTLTRTNLLLKILNTIDKVNVLSDIRNELIDGLLCAKEDDITLINTLKLKLDFLLLQKQRNIQNEQKKYFKEVTRLTKKDLSKGNKLEYNDEKEDKENKVKDIKKFNGIL